MDAHQAKDVGIRVRVSRSLRRDFVAACRQDGTPAARVLRAFMERYVSESVASQQKALFPEFGSPQSGKPILSGKVTRE